MLNEKVAQVFELPIALLSLGVFH